MNSPTSPMGLFSVINLLMLFLSGKANDVFLSFNHQEIGKNFADHFYKGLNDSGIRTFRDDGGIYTGQKSDIKRAIQESRISVVVFSKDYASSKKCLDQLVLIMDARRTTGLFVLPVFYNVNPSEVRKQKGLFEEAFAKHEKSFHKKMARVDSWRAALKEAADLKGKERKQDWYESTFIDSIVKEIADKLNLSLPHVPPSSLPLSSALRPPSYFFGLLREWRRHESKFIESIVQEIADKLNLSLPHVPPSALPLSSALRPPSYFYGLLREWRRSFFQTPLSLFIFFDFSLQSGL